MRASLWAEGLGTGLLLFVIVGSGMAVDSLGADTTSGLLAHALVVGMGLAVLIAMFITISGSHFNPAVSLAMWRIGRLSPRALGAYVATQMLSAVAGVLAAHATFAGEMIQVATVARPGLGRVLSEGIGTFVLVALILVLVRTDRLAVVPAAVGAWVATIVFGTASTGFANPAVTVARLLTDTYTGIAPRWVPMFLVAQVLGALAAVFVTDRLLREETSDDRIIGHGREDPDRPGGRAAAS